MSKIEKFLWIIAIPAVALISSLISWCMTANKMWGIDLAVGWMIIFFLALCIGLYHFGRRLHSRVQLTERHANWCLMGAIGCLVGGATIIMIAAVTTGFQSWLLPVTGGLLLAGMTCMAGMVFTRGTLTRS